MCALFAGGESRSSSALHPDHPDGDGTFVSSLPCSVSAAWASCVPGCHHAQTECSFLSLRATSLFHDDVITGTTTTTPVCGKSAILICLCAASKVRTSHFSCPQSKVCKCPQERVRVYRVHHRPRPMELPHATRVAPWGGDCLNAM